MVEFHPLHEKALSWLQGAKDGTHQGFVAAHSIAELYSVLTALPIQPRIPPLLARRLLHENVIACCNVVPLSDEDYAAVIDHLSEMRIVGGATYDALILYAAIKSDVDRVVTLNEKDFRKVYPHFANRLRQP
jgi:predicted nucleic acid-binding protein